MDTDKKNNILLKIILIILIIMLIFVVSFVLYHRVFNNKDNIIKDNVDTNNNTGSNEQINQEDNILEIEQIFKIGFVKESENELNKNDYFTIPTDMESNVIVIKAAKKGTNIKNIYEIDNTISEGSKIYVPEEMALITIMNDRITGIVAEPGMYTLKKNNSISGNESNISMIYVNNNNLSSNIKQSWEEYHRNNTQEIDGSQLAFFVNLNEINLQAVYKEKNIKSNYSIMINNPLLFVKDFVPRRYLQKLTNEYAFNDKNEAYTQLNNELLSIETNICDQVPNCYNDSFHQQFIDTINSSFLWEQDRGIKITKINVNKLK